ncbi:MAG: alkaline phosphatase D family protein [Nitrospirota bacterium]|nr:alkaline phosphatase D family protein [Nitrospirota bacterium]MDH5585521.1 alkaline phosphatase D family protein [Nitrospirota bacterium]MDH5773620.1 alkaline phosphatase D family protein [Nitrospirota bacterium]
MNDSFYTWLKWVGCLGSLLALMGCVTPEERNPFRSNGLEMGCAVGDVTHNEALVWVKTEGPQEVQVLYMTDDPHWIAPQETLLTLTSADRDFTARIPLVNLSPQTRYFYRMLVPGKRRGPICQFVTAPLPQDSKSVTFVIGGDTRNSFRPFSIFEFMREAEPDFFVYLGDTIYADKDAEALTLPDYWKKYVENRDGITQRLFATTPIFVMWDDHEVDSDFTMIHRRLPIGRQAFFDYWPIRSSIQDPYRLYRSFKWGKGVELFLLDCRQYRNPETKMMIGDEQKEWLLQGLAASSATFKFIVSSVPFSDPRDDKWGEYPDERDDILRTIKEQHIPGVIFLAGDVHHAAVSHMPHDPAVREFIFGPLAAPMNYKVSRLEPRFEFFHETSQNYGKVIVHLDSPTPFVQVEWFDPTNTLLHRVDVENEQYYPHEQE